ncbi:MAG: hypothetical protein MMC33_009642 [Icmadophila ericetorum]|nr:hypothetical protein [Icmadophila ericetorum]
MEADDDASRELAQLRLTAKQDREALEAAEKREAEERRRRQEAEQRTEEAEKREVEERKRTEEAEKREAEERKGRKEAEKREAEEQKKNQKTTLDEFVMACHEHFHLKMKPETRKMYQTRGGTTNPTNKYYPKRLAPWEDFPAVQQETYSQMWDLVHRGKDEHPRLFSPLLALKDLSTRATRPIGSEQDLEHYERTYVEDMVTRIMEHLHATELTREHFRLGEGVLFTNNANSMGETDGKALEGLEKVEAKRQITTPEYSPVRTKESNKADEDGDDDDKPTRARADQYFIWKKTDGKSKLILLVEYKPPHKISVEHLTYGFRPRSIDEFLANFKQPLTDAPEEVKAECKADKLCADVATQIFHYMIVNGLEYSYITTGKGLVFLRIKYDDPGTLYYHLSIPTEDVKQDKELGYLFPRTSVAQILSLCLMAFKTERRSVDWRKSAKQDLDEYAVNWHAILEGEGAIDSGPPKAGSNYKGRKNPIGKNSPYHTRAWRRCNPDREEKTLHDPDDDEGSGPETPTRRGKPNIQPKQVAVASKVDGVIHKNSRGRDEGGRRYKQPYCTQDCLAGLALGAGIDWNCPNVDLHLKCIYDKKHRINREQFAELVRKQLEETLDVNCEPLDIQGSRGALFRIRLASHGYVFVAKGTVRRFRRHIKHEGAIYKHLESLQGTAIPVYLGNIDLVDPYPYDFQVEIIHMLLMSWGGENKFDTVDWRAARATINEVVAAGILQGDEAERNLLWNEENQRYMLIDFERATYVQPIPIERREPEVVQEEPATGRVLQEISPNKKRASATVLEKISKFEVSSISKVKLLTAPTTIVASVEDKENFPVGPKLIDDGFAISEDETATVDGGA